MTSEWEKRRDEEHEKRVKERLYTFSDEELRKLHNLLEDIMVSLEGFSGHKDKAKAEEFVEWEALAAEFKGEIVRRKEKEEEPDAIDRAEEEAERWYRENTKGM